MTGFDFSSRNFNEPDDKKYSLYHGSVMGDTIPNPTLHLGRSEAVCTFTVSELKQIASTHRIGATVRDANDAKYALVGPTPYDIGRLIDLHHKFILESAMIIAEKSPDRPLHYYLIKAEDCDKFRVTGLQIHHAIETIQQPNPHLHTLLADAIKLMELSVPGNSVYFMIGDTCYGWRRASEDFVTEMNVRTHPLLVEKLSNKVCNSMNIDHLSLILKGLQV